MPSTQGIDNGGAFFSGGDQYDCHDQAGVNDDYNPLTLEPPADSWIRPNSCAA